MHFIENFLYIYGINRFVTNFKPIPLCGASQLCVKSLEMRAYCLTYCRKQSLAFYVSGCAEADYTVSSVHPISNYKDLI